MVFRFLILALLLFQTPEPPPDQRIGPASFRIFKQGNNIILAPVVPPQFKVALMEGPQPVTDEIQQCIIYAHFLSADDRSMTATVLKCGESKYGVTEVDFVMDEKKK